MHSTSDHRRAAVKCVPTCKKCDKGGSDVTRGTTLKLEEESPCINRKFASKPGFGGKDRDLLASLDAAGLPMVRAGCDDGAAKRH